MNKAAQELAMQLAQKEYSMIEYRNKLVRMQNMGLICHCSAEIDMGTLLYFSVNDMYLGKGTFVVILFSEVSSHTEDQDQGRDVFGRTFTYAIIEEIAREAFTGHYSFYSSELDGRLVVIINFPFGLMPDASIVNYLDVASAEVGRRCKERYDMDVVAYIGDPTDNLLSISSTYTKLLERATLHRYIEHVFDAPICRVRMMPPETPMERTGGLEERIRLVVTQLLSGEDFHPLTSELLSDLAENRASSVDELKRMFGDFFEEFCRLSAQVGIKIKKDFRRKQFQVVMDSVHWREAADWLHGMLDTVAQEHAERTVRITRKRFDQAVGFIAASLSDPDLSVEKCAAAVGCSVSALTKVFRREMNVSVAKYIREARLDMALKLVRQGSTVKTTCEKCGFGSTETFHRAFKAKYGATPGQLRGADLPDAAD